jgi:hypothetical protein
MRILVLGGTSFVGRAIVEDALRAGPTVEIVPVPPETATPLFPLIREDWSSQQRRPARARAAGLPATPPEVTAADVLAWDRQRGEPPLNRGFSPEREQAVIERYATCAATPGGMRGRWGEWSHRVMTSDREQVTFDTSVAHVARVYNYWLGGKDNFAADREAGEQAIRAFPNIVLSARANRAFLGRAVRFLAGETGIRQFLDIGTGIPAAANTHEVAQSVAPDSRIVYVDNDPIVLTHARALLTSDPAGATDYVEADLRDAQQILASAAPYLDLGRPVALMLMAILQHLDDAADPYQIVATLMGALPPGSYLALSHPAKDIDAEAMAKMADSLNRMMAEKVTFRDRPAVARFFNGLEVVEPGMVQASKWRPANDLEAGSPAALWAGVARKT